MVKIAFLLPTLLGFAAVLQAGMNRQIARDWGIGGATLLNAGVLFAVAFALCFLVTDLRPKFELQHLRWWFVVPGILGFCFVAGIPIAIAKIGATRVFVGLVAAQLAASLLWDFWMESMPISWPRVAGIALALLGVAISQM